MKPSNKKYISTKNNIKHKITILAAATLIFATTVGNAWSYNNNSINNSSMTSFKNVSRETSILPTSSLSPLPSVADICKSLLHSDNHSSLITATDKRQRTAGKVAAFGIVLGARFALEPNKKNTKKDILHKKHINNKTKINNRSARSIAAFRKCQKEYVLSNI